jgi:SAM-dependent methyltransferase
LARPGAAILDLACGRGRHARWFHARGHPVTAVDRDVRGLEDLRGQPQLELIEADLEGAPWPLPGRRFGAVIVTNYLWRPLFPSILDLVDEGGVLLYDTFARGNEAYGRPTNPDFLLEPGELIEVVRGRLQIVAYEHGRVERPHPAIRQRICAVRTDRPATLGAAS